MHFNADVVREVDRLGRLARHHLREHRRVPKERPDVTAQHTGLSLVAGQQHHHAALARGQAIRAKARAEHPHAAPSRGICRRAGPSAPRTSASGAPATSPAACAACRCRAPRRPRARRRPVARSAARRSPRAPRTSGATSAPQTSGRTTADHESRRGSSSVVERVGERARMKFAALDAGGLIAAHERRPGVERFGPQSDRRPRRAARRRRQDDRPRRRAPSQTRARPRWTG